MTEDEATATAHERNRVLGAQGATSKFYVPVQRDDQTWDVELRAEQQRPWWKRVAEALLESLTP